MLTFEQITGKQYVFSLVSLISS